MRPGQGARPAAMPPREPTIADARRPSSAPSRAPDVEDGRRIVDLAQQGGDSRARRRPTMRDAEPRRPGAAPPRPAPRPRPIRRRGRAGAGEQIGVVVGVREDVAEERPAAAQLAHAARGPRPGSERERQQIERRRSTAPPRSAGGRRKAAHCMERPPACQGPAVAAVRAGHSAVLGWDSAAAGDREPIGPGTPPCIRGRRRRLGTVPGIRLAFRPGATVKIESVVALRRGVRW